VCLEFVVVGVVARRVVGQEEGGSKKVPRHYRDYRAITCHALIGPERGSSTIILSTKTAQSHHRANMPIPLPPNPYAVGTPSHTAYSTCLAFQAQAPHLQVPWAATPTPLVCARLLGYMIIYSPTPQGRTNICNEINSCNGDRDTFHNLAKFYVDHYLRPCKYLHAL
jgi:hypothetical protein